MVKETYVKLYIAAQHLYSCVGNRKYYDLLEVPPDASEADLKKAYRKK